MNRGAAVKVYTRWRAVPAPEEIKAQLAATLAKLHAEAGWCCYDSGPDGTGYLTRALRLAAEAGDAYATWGAGATLVRNGHPNDALKLFQLGGFSASKSARATTRPDYPRLPTLTARLNLNSATAYAFMGGPMRPPTTSLRRTTGGNPAMPSNAQAWIARARGFIWTWASSKPPSSSHQRAAPLQREPPPGPHTSTTGLEFGS
jgi:hypothetical protein